MPRSRTFTNLKMGTSVPGNAGPRTFPADTGWFSSPVPCKHATMVIFRFKATDSNAFAGSNVSSAKTPTAPRSWPPPVPAATPSAPPLACAWTGPAASRIVVVPVDPTARFFNGYCQANIRSNAGAAHKTFTCDVEVFYDQDVNDAAQGAGQMIAAPV